MESPLILGKKSQKEENPTGQAKQQQQQQQKKKRSPFPLFVQVWIRHCDLPLRSRTQWSGVLYSVVNGNL